MFGVFGEAFAKFFGEEGFLALCFAIEREQYEDKAKQGSHFAL